MNNYKRFQQLITKASIETRLRPMFSRPEKDIPSGIVVFLVALPLCLGIALASGAPLISGLISGIIGGLVVGYLSQSEVSVSGPAASLTAVVIVAIQNLGSFDVFLLSLVIGGVIQLGFGLAKAGLIADYMPTSIIKGLLAAIGLILIISQIPYALGIDQESRLLDYSRNFLSDPPDFSTIMSSFSPGAIIITTISLLLIIYWDKTVLRKFKLVPPFLVVVILGVLINLLFKYMVPSLFLDSIKLVSIPQIDSLSSFLTFPDFTAIGNPQVWTYGFTIALIASIASLLAIEAADNLDPHKRRSPPNRELVAQGIGNTLAGLIGGIPITSVIVRSSVNIGAGAETKLSTIVHGILLLASVFLLSSIINLIPLASLAAILLMVGYKLASISIFKSMFKKGWEQFIPFAVTTIGILFSDVLVGVLIGTASSLFFLLRGNFYNPFYIEIVKSKKRKEYRLELSNEVSFLNKPAIKKTLWGLPKNSKIVIDATFTTYVERDVIEILNDYQNTFAIENGIDVVIIGLRESYDSEVKEELSKGAINYEKNIGNPQDILDSFINGNQRYVDGNLVSKRLRNKELLDFIKDAPLATVINCMDMREPLNMLLNTGIGDLIPLKAAGNLISDNIIYSSEIACRKQGAKLILLMGNSRNSFIKEGLEHYIKNEDSYLRELLKPAIDAGILTKEKTQHKDLNEIADEITIWNLEESKRRIIQKNEFIRREVIQGNIGLCSAFFNRKTGKIDFSELYEVTENEKETQNLIQP
ncbi:bifunctional SulP family inorganic anion transporter/carbonic anhydrase [Fulvivirgaceae bacterium LMO-SS25]